MILATLILYGVNYKSKSLADNAIQGFIDLMNLTAGFEIHNRTTKTINGATNLC